MKSVMLKTTLREIRHSLGRYIAILAIVALGVGFFAGLKATKPAMVETTEKYLNELRFYDFRLLSTLGFDETDIETFQDQKGVETAVGSYSFDIICEADGNDNSFVAKTHSITTGVNDLHLMAGRMAETAKECVVDSKMFDESWIGKKITFSAENEEEDLQNFINHEFTIVGVVQSPLYIQFERGNTSLGNGKLSCFLYLMPETFDSEAYSEAYIKFKDDFPLHSEEYAAFIEDKEEDWTLILKEAANRRADEIREEANEKLADAQEELDTERAKAEKELEDAKEQLEDAEKQLEEGRAQLEAAKEELATGRKELAAQEKVLAEGEKELNDKEALLLEKETELNNGILTWQQNNQTIMDTKTQLRIAEAEISSQENQLAYMEQTIAVLDSLISVVEDQIKQQERDVQESEKELNEQEAELSAYEAQMKAQYPDGIPADIQEEINQERADITEEKARVERQKQQIRESKALLEDNLLSQYNSYVKQIEDGRKQLEEAKAQVISGWRQLDAGEQQLNQAWVDIVNGQTQINAGKTEIANARQELADGKVGIAGAYKTMEDGEATIAEKEQELAEGQAEYEAGLAEYEDGLKEFEEKMAEAESELLEAQRKVDEINSPDTYVLGRNTNVGYVCFENDCNIVEDVAAVFPIFFFMVAALVCMTTMNRMVEEQRTQIGVLKGIGYSEVVIMSKYLTYSGSAALIGCIAGFFAMTYIFPMVIWMCYGMMYDVAPVTYYFDWRMLVIAIAISLLCSVGTTWYCCRNELKEVAAQLMRPKAPEAGRRIFLEKIDFIWKRLKFLQKVSIRNVFRYKKRFIMMIIGISGCTSLIVAGFGIEDSIADVINQQYSEIFKYDMSVTFKNEITPEIIEEFEEVVDGRIQDYTVVMEGALDIRAEDITKSVNLVIFRDTTEVSGYIDLHTTKKKPVVYPGNGQVVITHKIADTYNITTGSTVTLLDDAQNSITAVVSGINENFVTNYVFMNGNTYEQSIGRPAEYQTIYINVPEDGSVDQHVLSADIMKMYDVAAVIVNLDSIERFDVMMSSLDYIVLLVILCAAALAFIVLYNLTNINITERVREIATIKVLGFYKKETSAYVFRENMILTVIGALFGLILGKWLHAFVMDCIKIDMVSFDVRVRGISYVYAVVLTYIFATCVNLMMRKKIDRISMTESLKSVD